MGLGVGWGGGWYRTVLLEELQDCMRLGTSPRLQGMFASTLPPPLPAWMTKGFQPLIEDDARSLGTLNKR